MLWSRVDSAVRSGNKAKTNQEIKDDIIKIIKDSHDRGLPKGDISEALKQGKAWNVD